MYNNIIMTEYNMCITSVYAVMGILYIMPLVLQIHCDDVDFWMLHKKGMLDLQIERKIYPPKITVLFGTLPSTEERSVIIHFAGCSKDLDKPIILLRPPISGKSMLLLSSSSHIDVIAIISGSQEGSSDAAAAIECSKRG